MSFGDWGASLLQSGFDNFVANTDPTIGTSDKNVAAVRTSLPFSDIVLTFPVTDRNAKIRLPAFLESHSDSFNPSWRATEVYGRNDPIPVYSNTTRSISVSFKIPNHDSEDANENLRKLNRIIQNLYPAYKAFGSGDKSGLAPNLAIVGAPLARLKFANLICNSDNPTKGLLGYINNLSVSMNPSNGYLMASSFLGVGDQPALFPRMIDFSFTFVPLHEHNIGWGENNNWLGKKRTNFPYKSKLTPGDAVEAVATLVGADSGGVLTNLFGT